MSFIGENRRWTSGQISIAPERNITRISIQLF